MKRYFQAFAYPLSGENGFVMILGVAALSILPSLYSILPFSGGYWDSWLGLLFLGYYALYLRSILGASMEGKNGIPPWPDWEHPDECFQNLFSVLAPFLVSFLPLLVLRVAFLGFDGLDLIGIHLGTSLRTPPTVIPGWVAVASLLLVGLGWLYFPMSVLVWTFYGGWGILNPVAVARTAWQTGPSYLVLCVLTGIAISGAWCVTLLPSGWLTTFGASLLVFYAFVVSMRMIGTHYNIHRERLGWETRGRPEAV